MRSPIARKALPLTTTAARHHVLLPIVGKALSPASKVTLYHVLSPVAGKVLPLTLKAKRHRELPQLWEATAAGRRGQAAFMERMTHH